MKYQDLNSFSVPPEFRGRSKIVVQLWWLVQGTLFQWSPQFLYNWRSFLLKLFGAEIGKNVKIRSTVKITYPWKIRIGDFSWIGDDSVLYSLEIFKLDQTLLLHIGFTSIQEVIIIKQ